MSKSKGSHRKRLFIGEASFLGVKSFLDKHKDSHPNLGKSIIATRLEPEYCDNCKMNKEHESWEKMCVNDECLRNRIQYLRNHGVTIIHEYDGRFIHTHRLTNGQRFKRIHWICPHDRSNYENRTLPGILKEFFASANQVQDFKDRIHVTLCQSQAIFYQGITYDIYDAANSSGYSLFAKRPFNEDRYPGYKHHKTGDTEATNEIKDLKEFVFLKGNLDMERGKNTEIIETDLYVSGITVQRNYYERDTDNESTSCSSHNQSNDDYSGSDQDDDESFSSSNRNQSNDDYSGSDQDNDESFSSSNRNQSNDDYSGSDQDDDESSRFDQDDDKSSRSHQHDYEFSGSDQDDDKSSGSDKHDDETSGSDQDDDEWSDQNNDELLNYYSSDEF